MPDINTLISQLEIYDDAYHNGDSIIPDSQYDRLKEDAHKLAPKHPYFIQIGSDVRGGKVKLPYTMGGLRQIYEGDYDKWSDKFNLADTMIAISHKLDGVSCMLQYKNGQLYIAYSRGNGVMGADITRHVRNVKNIPQSIDGNGHITIRGELIMKETTFNTNWLIRDAKNARNTVAGMFNRKINDIEDLNDVDFIAYQIVDASPEYITDNQKSDMIKLDDLGFNTVVTLLIKGGDLNDDILSSTLALCRKHSEYELDGLVLTINQKNYQKQLSNSSSLNPEHAVKFKILDDSFIVQTEVVDVIYDVSKNGYLKPRIEVIPVQLFGTTVTFASGFNGKNIVDNGVGPGAIVRITKGGQVIPDIIEYVKKVTPKLPNEEWEWNETGVEMVIHDAQNHPDVIFKQVLDFFNTLNVDLLKEASLRTVIDVYSIGDGSFELIVKTIFNMLEMEWIKIIGANGTKIYASLTRRLEHLTLDRYLGAIKYFGVGFGVRRAKLLLKNLDNENDVWNLTVPEIVEFEGFDTVTAQKFISGIKEAKSFLDDLEIKIMKEEKTTELNHLNVVFTGFRDKEFQDKLEKLGAKVSSGVSKKTTHLLTAEPNSTSSKAVKARELGVITMSLDEFKEEFDL